MKKITIIVGHPVKASLSGMLAEAYKKGAAAAGAQHLVFVTPIWWGSMTALLKGFFDRAFLPGITFKYQESGLPLQLMKDKSARVLITMDAPLWYYKIFVGRPLELLMKRAILGFCGVKPVQISYFAQVRNATKEKIQQWKSDTEKLGATMV